MTAAAGRPVVFVDADNTLWDTDGVFAQAQLAMLTAVERAIGRSLEKDSDRLAFIRSVDQAIAASHHDGLRYPPKLLVEATARALMGRAPARAAREAERGGQDKLIADAAADVIVGAFFEALRATPALREGVPEGLARLEAAGCSVLIVTEAKADKVEATAATLGLAGHFDRVIEGRKRPELYHRILKLVGSPARAFMIGDQLDRDIAPAKSAGLGTIYFPGGFAPSWQMSEGEARPDHRISSFAEVPALVLVS